MSIWETIAQKEAELRLISEEIEALRAQLLNGIDASQFNGGIEWLKVQGAGKSFAFLRVADGDVVDLLYKPQRVEAVRSAGLIWGPYFLGRVASPANRERNGREEAGMAIYLARTGGWPHPGALPLAYDFETLNGQTPEKAATHLYQFVHAYHYLVGDHYPILYINPSTWNAVRQHIPDDQLSIIARCPLWVASYGVAAPPILAGLPAPQFWQYTSSGTCPGVTGDVDLDYFGGTVFELNALTLS